jgi:Lhr-like helicases
MSTKSQDFIRKLRESGYVNLTPIQRLAIPKVLSGTHLLIIAPTGHGKTEAAIIPIMYNIYMKRPKKISALYLTPLRALNRDIQYRLDKLGQSFQIKVSTRHGDSTRKERRDLLQDPPDLLISTPETLLYLLVDKRVRELLTGVRWVVIDEVQEMLDEKRGYELSVMLQRLRLIARNPQMIGLSATLGDVELAKTVLSTER